VFLINILVPLVVVVVVWWCRCFVGRCRRDGGGAAVDAVAVAGGVLS